MMENIFATIVLAAFFGILLKIVAYRLKIPAILPLLVGGIILGPYGFNVIQPAYLNNGLPIIISVCIGIILFESGLSLDVKGFHSSPKVIGKLLSLGVFITWIGIATMAWLMLDFSYGYSLLLGSLIIVTGPSVITPILQRIKVRQNLKHILNWEAVFIDPIGAFIAIFCFEWLTTEGTHISQILRFSGRFLTGAAIGFAAGSVLYLLMKRKIVPPVYTINFTLVFILLTYFISNFIAHESGLLTVVVAGLSFAVLKPHGLKKIQSFKIELSELALAVLFVLLAANLQLENFYYLTVKEWLFIGMAAFLVRPVSICLCTYQSDLTRREKIFLAWVAPRGIVAASIASLFSIELKQLGFENAAFIETFAYAIIILTVVLQGGTAELLAKVLNLKKDETPMLLLVGANRFARELALTIEAHSHMVCYLIDTNHHLIDTARRKGLSATLKNALAPEEVSPEIISSLHALLVLTDNEELNTQICEVWSNYLKKNQLFYWGCDTPIKSVGKAIWCHIPKPSNSSLDLKDKKTEFIVSHDNKDTVHIHYNDNLLLAIKSDKSMIEIA